MQAPAVKITVETTVPVGRIADLLCCALEGGMAGQWACHTETVLGSDDSGLDKEGWSALGGIYRAPLTSDGYLMFEDEEDGQTYKLNRDNIAAGLQKMAEEYPTSWGDFIAENEDAITGDVFLQLCLLGDVVYG